MKTKFVTLILLTLALCATATSQKTSGSAASPEAVVRNLYAAHNGKNSPFFQRKNRALVNKYFTGSLADAIWKDALDSKPGEVGNLDFDPLYYAQDVQIKNFVIGKADENNQVKVRFVNMGKQEVITFSLTTANTSSKVYKIDSIVYGDGEDLESVLSYDLTSEAAVPLDGDYMVGRIRCSVMTTKNGYWARVQCEDQKDFQVIDTETLTFGTFDPKDKGRRGNFVVGSDGSIVKYVDGSGKTVAVTRAK